MAGSDILSQAAGRVCTGFSKPYVAQYSYTGGAVSYSTPAELARGVSVAIDPESSDANVFYANNIQAEQESGIFSGGTLTLTVDGLLIDKTALLMGLEFTDGTDKWIAFGDSANTPFFGVGFITRYRSGGVTTFVPTIITKVKFDQIGNEAETQEENIDWQTQELTAQMYRDDSEAQTWKYEGIEYESEADAVTALLAKFG